MNSMRQNDIVAMLNKKANQANLIAFPIILTWWVRTEPADAATTISLTQIEEEKEKTEREEERERIRIGEKVNKQQETEQMIDLLTNASDSSIVQPLFIDVPH